ncbi:MAG: hypothetical protein ILP09_06490 [Oscillospiraceae bacterium]|nr:hypothetical protein [Oscillospiraceae bacterium]
MHIGVRPTRGVLAAVLCVLLLVSLSYAWLTLNRKADSEGIQMQMDAQSMSITNYRVYKYNSETNAVDDITSDETIYELEPYDSIFTERNVNTPLLLRVKLKGFPAESTAIDFSISCIDGHTNMIDRFTSNIVYAKYATESMINAYAAANGETAVSTSYAGNDLDGLYHTATKYFGTVNEKNQFAHAAPSSGEYNYNYAGEKTMSLDCSLSLTAAEKTARETVVYLIIDYEPDLIEAQHITHFSDIQLQLGSAIKFANDIKLISFSYRLN